jgi:hydroxymethylbilane synthase
MYPIVLSLKGRPAVVVGGGAVAARKIGALLEAEAAVTVVAPTLDHRLEELAEAGVIEHRARGYEPGDLAGAFLAFAATDDETINAAVTAEARAAGILANDAGDAGRGDFTTPATHRSGPLLVTVDTGGLSPGFTKRIRDELALQFDTRYGKAATALGLARDYAHAVLPKESRMLVMRALAERDLDELAALARADIENEVERIAVNLASPPHPKTGALVCASRGSLLAMTQTRQMMARLASGGIASTVLVISTKGDQIQDRSLAAVGSDGVFVKELELALRERRADYAVHSCKDLPSVLPDDMTIAAFTKREDARDAYCSEKYPTFADLPAGARVGTSSPRRRAQLMALRDDLVYDDVRGNVDTRLRKLRDGDYAAIVLATAGLNRLNLRATYTVPFSPEELVPAVGQGALAIETRLGDDTARAVDAIVGDAETTLCVLAERAFLRRCRGGCQAPIGAHATYANGELHLRAAIATVDGTLVLRDEARVRTDDRAEAEALGDTLAGELLGRGGDVILNQVRSTPPLADRTFLLPRTQDRPSRIAAALRAEGATVVEATNAAEAHAALAMPPHAILFPSSGSVSAITEYLAQLRDDGVRPAIVAMGPASAAAAEAAGFAPDAIAPEADVASFVHTIVRHVMEHGV